MKDGDVECCSSFDPKKWDKKKVTWKDKMFIKDKVFSFFHVPLNFTNVIHRNTEKIKKAKASLKDTMVLTDEASLFHTNVYISTKRAIPGVHDVKVSGTFLTRVFEGSYSNIKKWTKEMEEYVKLEKKQLKHMYYYYTQCPKCAKEKEKKYVVLFAEI